MLSYGSAALQVGCVMWGCLLRQLVSHLFHRSHQCNSTPGSLLAAELLSMYVLTCVCVFCGVAVGLCVLSAPLFQQQELCLGLMSLLVLQQPQDADVVTAATNHAVWLLQCAEEGQLPAHLLCASNMQALTACLSTCAATLHELGLLGLYWDR